MTCTPHTQQLHEDEDSTSALQRSRRRGGYGGWQDCQGRQAGRVGWRAGWGGGQGGVAGRVGWRAGWGGGPGLVAGQVVGGGWIFGVKNVLE